jgi:hypothetical protein
MVARGPRALLALLLTAGAGAFGVAALATATASTAGADQPPAVTCQGLTCAPVVQVVSMNGANGTVRVTYSATKGILDLGSLSGTVTWSAPATVPAGAPEPVPTSAPLINGKCAANTASTFVTCDFPFPAPLLDNKFLLNGSYQVTGSAQDCVLSLNCTQGTGTHPAFPIANPPTAPTNVKSELAANNSAVKISWTPSPEPDVTGYQVLRADGSVACQLAMVPVPEEYACTDTPTKDGSYAYYVVAHRWAPGYSTAVKDQPASKASETTKAVAVVGTSANTTTTVPGGGTGNLGPPGFTGKVTPGKTLAPGAGANGLKIAPGSPAVVVPDTPTTPDPGFSPSLPYGAKPPQDPGTITADPSPLAAPVAPHKGKTSVGTIAVVGAGLLIGVIALHGLWLRSEVRRTPVLEVLEPEA